MKWTDVFPVFDDAMVDECENKAAREERRELADWFSVREVVNRRGGGAYCEGFAVLEEYPVA